MNKQTTYADSGVNIELGDDASQVLYEAAKLTWENRKDRLGKLVVPFDDFSGVRAIDVSGLPKGTLMNIGFDGVGTKMELAERVGDHRTIAYDLFAMVCDDAVVRGAEPVLIGSILDVNSLGKDGENYIKQIKQLAEGYIGAAKAANVAIVNGEVAELGSRVGGYGKFNYNWGAAVVWFANKDRMFTGREIKEGDLLVGLREEGFRSNGLSLVRRIMQKNYGDDWHQKSITGGHSLERVMARAILTPSRIYTGAVVDMFGGYNGEPRAEIHGVAHITGGGIPGKLGRVLKPNGLGANIVFPFEPSDIMSYIQSIGQVSDEEAYKTWNMGQGMIVIIPNSSDRNVIEVAKEHRISSRVIGEVVKNQGITIKSAGVYSRGKEIKF